MKHLPKIEKAFEQVLECLSEEYGLDITHPNFTDTPKRVARAYAEIFDGLDNTQERLEQILSTSFPCKYGGMVLVRDIRVFSMCPHHFFPVSYRVDLAYVPSKKGHVLGLSKLPRITELLAKRPVLQEKFTEDITDALMEIKGAEGAACLVRGAHYCMIMRGACKPDTVTIMSSLKGVFEKEDATRAEFMAITRETV